MQKQFMIFSILVFVTTSFCSAQTNLNITHTPLKYSNIAEIPCPKGYKRSSMPPHSFGTYLRTLPLKQKNNTVYLHNGLPKYNQEAQFSIVKMDVGKRDLQQCADAIMRLRAEYLFHQNKRSQIKFNFVNGMEVTYSKYAEGYRMKVKGNKTWWVKTTQPNYSYQTFRKYMNLIFAYAGTASLVKELKPVKKMTDIQVGDVFIIGGSPGHAVVVVDIAQNAIGKKIFMIAQSYMPAQEIHVLKNPAYNQSPWYYLEDGGILDSPEYLFKSSDLRRF